jgi:hypothetical protein
MRFAAKSATATVDVGIFGSAVTILISVLTTRKRPQMDNILHRLNLPADASEPEMVVTHWFPHPPLPDAPGVAEEGNR